MNKNYLLVLFYLSIALFVNACHSNKNYDNELKIIANIKSTGISTEYTRVKRYDFIKGAYVLVNSYSDFKAYDKNKNLINENDHLIYGYDPNLILRTKYEVYKRGPDDYLIYKYTYHYNNNKLSQIRYVKILDWDSNFVFKELVYNNAGEIIKETNHDKGFYTRTTILYSKSLKIAEIDSEYNFNVNKILVNHTDYIYKNGILIKSIEEDLNKDYKKYTFYTYRDNGDLVITKDTTISNLPMYKYENNLNASDCVAFNKTETYYKNKKKVKFISYGPDYKTPFYKIEYTY